MSEAVLLAILAPIAGAIATLLVKLWDSFANRKKLALDENAEFREELRKEIDRKNEELTEAKAHIERQNDYENEQERELRLWQRRYFELYSMFYPLRIIVMSLPEGKGRLAESALGPAPHERDALDTRAPGA